MAFKDHFSERSDAYRRFRPRYPDGLFHFLADQAPHRDLAVDIATGTGQAATALAPWFAEVRAFDASAAQIAHAEPCPGVSYAVAIAEELPLPDQGADLLTVAQALHWLDLDRFWPEARRVLRPGGVIAVWNYNRLRIDPAIDDLVEHLYTDLVGPYWPPERALIENDYRDLAFPFRRLDTPAFAMEARWNREQLLGYLDTWSAVRRYRKSRGEDPLAVIEPRLSALFGPGLRTVKWPMSIRVGTTP